MNDQLHAPAFFCWNTMLYVGSTKKKNSPSFFNIFTPQKTHAKTHPLWFLWILIGWTPGSLWCNIFTLLYTLKSNYGAPPLPQACWWDRCLGNELEIGLLSCFFFGGGTWGKAAIVGFVAMKRRFQKCVCISQEICEIEKGVGGIVLLHICHGSFCSLDYSFWRQVPNGWSVSLSACNSKVETTG